MRHKYLAASQKWLHFFIIIVVLTGLFFRFVNIDKKVYWFDESATTSRISRLDDYVESVKGQIISVEKLNEFQNANPLADINEVVENLFWVPQHTPLYFLTARFWAQEFGISVRSIRSLSAIISLFVFPALYWLSIELFQSSLVAWISIALVAVSPFHILYAQEARMYSLLTVLILLASAALLRAQRVRTKQSWGIYSVTLALGLWSHTIFSLTVISHGIYIAVTGGFRRSKVAISYLMATLFGLILFCPWIFVLFDRSSRLSTLDWQHKEISLSTLARYWGINISRLFFDIVPTYRLDTNFSDFSNPLLVFLIAAILLFVVYALYFLSRRASTTARLFVITLIGIPVIALVLPDVIVGGIRSNNPRYLIAPYLGIQLASAYLFANKIEALSTQVLQQKLWRGMTVVLLSLGILSATVSSQAETWWNKYYSSELPPIAKIVNQTPNPLLIVDSDGGILWSFKDLLKPNVRFLLLADARIPVIPKGFSDVFIFEPSEDLQENLVKKPQFRVVPVHKEELSLWKLEPGN
jgi:uncharacterized membrane protein